MWLMQDGLEQSRCVRLDLQSMEFVPVIDWGGLGEEKSDDNALEDRGVGAGRQAQAADMRRQQKICLPVWRRGLHTMEAAR